MTTTLTKSKKSGRPAVHLTERDLDTLAALGSYRFLSVPQLKALFFPSNGAAEERMRALLHAGLVTRVFMPVRPYDRKAHTIYAISASGARTLAEMKGGMRPKHLTEHERRSGLFLDHTLRRNDVRICLELLNRSTPGFQLLLWRQSPEEIRGSTVIRIRSRHERIPIVPDGFFAVSWKGVVNAFALEVDMATVRLERMAIRYKAYHKWWREGGTRARYGSAPLRILTMTTTRSRLTALRKVASTVVENGRFGSRLFWFSLLSISDLDKPEKLLGASWSTATPDATEEKPLLA